MTRIMQQVFERHEAVAETEPHAETQTGLIGAAEHPGIVSGQSMGPQRLLAGIEKRRTDRAP